MCSCGRISHGPQTGESWAGATTDGVVARTVRDSAAMLDVLSGRRTGDPYSATPPERPFAAEVGADPGALRIGLAPTHAGVDTHPECAEAVEGAGRLLQSLGHQQQAAIRQTRDRLKAAVEGLRSDIHTPADIKHDINRGLHQTARK